MTSHASRKPAEMQAAHQTFHTLPQSQRLQSDEQKELDKPISESEVRYAIDQLPRVNKGGTKGISHDFYKVINDEIAECLTAVYRAIQKRAAVPKSFLEAVVVPLKTKEDSTNAMDYRPISLLNTAYKILGNIYAERIHRYLPRVISEAQQGFVRGRADDEACYNGSNVP
ncbi:hypothetical protein PHMEG_0003458 [Phytophthora megakarya]|uniref:Reverse transcriptase n=1 Tax=Phytophthora megakarya TaxID=4795 RepID=A0A225WXT2_9STRA|nr:hypothetical protein PHMEG_0003458 [Phytophthora megakarya]